MTSARGASDPSAQLSLTSIMARHPAMFFTSVLTNKLQRPSLLERKMVSGCVVIVPAV